MADSIKNLEEAFAGESQANRTYLFFAEKAEVEGKPAIARLFRAVAEAETVHARSHLRMLKGIGTTAENLKKAASGERYEFTSMYPAFIQQAAAEGNKDVERGFNWANQVEQIHHGLYEKALKALEAGAEPGAEPYMVCQTCGYTVQGEAPERCPICGALKRTFKKVE